LSSILDALKRLEAERRTSGDIPPPAWLDRAEVRPGRLARFQESMLIGGRKWLAAGMLLAALAVAVWIGWRTVSSSPQAPAPAVVSGMPEPKPVLADVPPAQRQPPKPAVSPSTPASRPSVKTAPPASPMPWAESHSTPVIAAPPTPAASPPALAPPPSDGSLPPLPAEVGLSLQAVSWAARAQERIAVVNGQIMRQGDDIEGYTVRDIDADAVVLCRSGECHRLAFAFGK
jgi:hypothetical protein